MSINHYTKVKMPEEKITFNSSNKKGTEYVYYTKRAYRNSKNQPTSEKVLVGKKDPETGMLIPNKNYYDIFEEDMVLYTKSILDFGNYFVMSSILKNAGVTEILKKVFPEEFKEIITIAIYMLCESNVMFYCEDWCSETYTELDSPITSQSSSRLFSTIDYDDKMKFFKAWAKHIMSNEYIAYDVTSFSSYSEGNDDLEWGYNRDKEKLPQFNLGMYYGESTKLPVYYCTYPGSILDKSHLKYMMRDNKALGIKKIKLVMDKGFYDVSNLKYLENKGYPFVICVSNSLSVSKEYLARHRISLTSSRYYSNSHDIYAFSEYTDKYSVKANIHIYYDPAKAMIDENELYQKISVLENRLSQSKELPSKKMRKQYEKYFDIAEKNDGGFSYGHNYEKIDNEKAFKGFFLLLTTDLSMNSIEILEIYRRKDLIEKCFNNLKNSIDMKRIRCHNKPTTDGKVFIAFISLIIRSYIENKLSEYMKNNNSTIEKVIRQLKKIKVVKMQDGQSLMNPLTKKQKEILSYFGSTEKDIKNKVAQL